MRTIRGVELLRAPFRFWGAAGALAPSLHGGEMAPMAPVTASSRRGIILPGRRDDPTGDMSHQEQLEAIARGVRRCKRCRLWRTRTHAMPGHGSAQAEIVFIGEAPGRAEDASGLPFQGMAGREFDALLALAGLAREQIFVTGVNKCRPPGNRRPRRDEMATCRQAHLDRQLAVIAPRLVVLMGTVAVEELLGRKSLAGLLGRIVERDGRRYFVTYHPAASMRFPAARRAARRHFSRLPGIAGG